jgi:HEAT repeat protein
MALVPLCWLKYVCLRFEKRIAWRLTMRCATSFLSEAAARRMAVGAVAIGLVIAAASGVSASSPSGAGQESAKPPAIVRGVVTVKFKSRWANQLADQAIGILLGEAGVKKVPPDAKDYAATLSIEITGRPLSCEVNGKTRYSGAEINGEITIDGEVPCSEKFEARLDPHSQKSNELYFDSDTPYRAPLGEVLEDSEMVGAMARLVSRVWKKDEVLLLAKILADEDKSLQRGAAVALAKLGQPGMQVLVSAVRQSSAARRAAWGLSRMGEPGLQQLLELSKSGDRRVQEAVIPALGWAANPKGAPPALQALKDKDPGLRATAAWALGRMGGKQAVAALAAALQDEVADVRLDAVIGLGRIGQPALQELIGAMTNRDASVRQRAAAGLERLRNPASVPALIAGMKDTDREVRWWCMHALEEWGDEQTVEVLAAMLGDEDGEFQFRAEKGLVRIGSPAVPALMSALKQDKRGVGMAIHALEIIGDERALPALREYAATHSADSNGVMAKFAIEGILSQKNPK